MTNTAKALYGFFSQFGIPAYPEGGVPTYTYDAQGNRAEVKPPYITYQVVRPNWRAQAPLYARVWYRSTTYAEIGATVDAIAAAIGEGVSLPTEDGAVYLYQEDTFAQYQDMAGDATLKCAYLSMSIHALTT